MDLITALTDAQNAFADRLALVTPDQLPRPSVCRGWTVFGLINHTIVSNRTYRLLLDGAPRDQATSVFVSEIHDIDLAAAFADSAGEVRDRFRQPGVLEQVYPHPTMDLPGEVLLPLRILDDTLHAWDLARSIGADEHLPHTSLSAIWELISPQLDVIGGTGTFGAGPSGTIGPAADLQTRVLDATGRRP